MAKRQLDKESHYKEIIRKQKAVIKSLAKKAGRGDKLQERYDEALEFASEIEDEEKSKVQESTGVKCPVCLKGTIETIDLKVRKIDICDMCRYRLVKK